MKFAVVSVKGIPDLGSGKQLVSVHLDGPVQRTVFEVTLSHFRLFVIPAVLFRREAVISLHGDRGAGLYIDDRVHKITYPCIALQFKIVGYYDLGNARCVDRFSIVGQQIGVGLGQAYFTGLNVEGTLVIHLDPDRCCGRTIFQIFNPGLIRAARDGVILADRIGVQPDKTYKL